MENENDEFKDMEQTWGCEHDFHVAGDGRNGRIDLYRKCVKCNKTLRA